MYEGPNPLMNSNCTFKIYNFPVNYVILAKEAQKMMATQIGNFSKFYITQTYAGFLSIFIFDYTFTSNFKRDLKINNIVNSADKTGKAKHFGNVSKPLGTDFELKCKHFYIF